MSSFEKNFHVHVILSRNIFIFAKKYFTGHRFLISSFRLSHCSTIPAPHHKVEYFILSNFSFLVAYHPVQNCAEKKLKEYNQKFGSIVYSGITTSSAFLGLAQRSILMHFFQDHKVLDTITDLFTFNDWWAAQENIYCALVKISWCIEQKDVAELLPKSISKSCGVYSQIFWNLIRMCIRSDVLCRCYRTHMLFALQTSLVWIDLLICHVELMDAYDKCTLKIVLQFSNGERTSLRYGNTFEVYDLLTVCTGLLFNGIKNCLFIGAFNQLDILTSEKRRF